MVSILKTGSREKRIEKKESRELMLSLLSPHLKDWLEFQVGINQLTTENVHVFWNPLYQLFYPGTGSVF